MTGARVDAVDAIRDRRIDDFFVANKPSVIPVTPGQLRDVIKLLFPKIRDFITVNYEHLLEMNEGLRSQISCLEKELAVLRNEMQNQKRRYADIIGCLKASTKKKKKKINRVMARNGNVQKALGPARERKPILRPAR